MCFVAAGVAVQKWLKHQSVLESLILAVDDICRIGCFAEIESFILQWEKCACGDWTGVVAEWL